LTAEKQAEKKISAREIRMYGIVQGVGFRPFVSRAADRTGVRGSVANKGSFVEIHAQGGNMDEFLRILREEQPERSDVIKMEVKETAEPSASSFEIIESEKEEGDIFVSPDIATCDKCRAELFDPKNRRYLHPFINCTACGPRVTIMDSMPYDREVTSMGEFPMCPECEWEYTHAETRRYDAQPVCCNDCGPEVYLLNRRERGREAITAVRRAIMDGKIAAVKGIGGFHLCCDAANPAAVRRLRGLKNRPMKPFAVMLRNLETARRECRVLPEQESLLTGHQKPILLLRKRDGGRLCPEVAPDNPNVGVMLPYAPVQMLLFDYDDGVEMTDALVMTSGNVSGAPICRDDADAMEQIAGFCDLILSHNRKIRLRADDSVTDWLEGKPYMIRRSRGYAPLPYLLSAELPGQVLGIGGELKNTFCVGKNGLFYLSPYVGDMADVRTVNALRESVTRLDALLEAKPQAVACDLHPKYNSVMVAEELGLPVIRVQHHYAHVVSCMAENDVSGEVIGVSFDGTGYGTDGTVWGGEFFRASYDGFTRLGSIHPFLQIGGDVSAREGWRIAAAMLHDLYGAEAAAKMDALHLCTPQEAKILETMAEKRINAVTSTSAGRLFDAVSAILGIRRASTYESESSVSLQFAAEAWNEAHSGDGPVWTDCGLETEGGFFRLPTEKLVRELTERRLSGEDAGKLAYGFHTALADLILAGAERIRADTGLQTCALSGGVFQNRLLTALCAEKLRRAGFTVLLHSLVPPNDGGIALGQAVAAAAQINREKKLGGDAGKTEVQ
jgi:hydrogenase maturation protein HypF